MVKLIDKYRSLSFEGKTIFTTKISILMNLCLGIGKIILSFFMGVFFAVAGIVNICIVMAKSECYVGVKEPHNKSFNHRNKFISAFLFVAGLQYSIYMGRLIFTDISIMDYDMILGISIACVSFVELAIAIKGCFNSFGKGHYYRNIKLISLCSALTAIVLTEVALTSFAAEGDTRLINGIVGMLVGIVIILISIYIYYAPRVSIVDREHNIYRLINGNNSINEEKVNIKLTNSKFYGDYVYIGINKDNIIDGHINKEKSPIFGWNIYIKILIIVLSEILIFPYAIGALVFHIKCRNIIKKLDLMMIEKGYEKVYIE